MMTTSEIVSYLKGLADATTEVAMSADTARVSKARLTMQAVMLLEAIDRLEALEREREELQSRLVRQACYFEQFEARHEPRFPLLEDDDPGAGL